MSDSIVPDLSFTDYLAHEAIGSSTAKHMIESSQLFWDHMTGVAKMADKPHFKIGTIAHMMVLEPDRFKEQVVTEGPINPSTGSMYKRDSKKFATWQEENPDKMVVEPWLYTMLERMPADVKDIFDAKGVAELSIFEPLNNVSVKCRPDWLMPDHIYDLKTIDDINRIDRQIRDLKYWFTSGWYRMVMDMATGKSHEHTFIFCEKKAPYRWRIVTLCKDDFNFSLDLANEVMQEMDACFALDDFSDRKRVHQEVDLKLRKWAKVAA